MTAASPTPVGLGHYAAPTRKSSLRSGLRNIPTRSHASRAESNSGSAGSHASKSQFTANADSSDDEIPVPMKLSALTKALLNDGGPEQHERENARARTTRAQSHKQPSSPVHAAAAQDKQPVRRRGALNASVASNGEERRQTRASSAQMSSRPTSPVRSQPSRENSPVRKRVVRLSASSGAAGTGAFGGASAAGASAAGAPFKPAKRRSTSLSASQRGNRPPSRDSIIAEERANASEIRDNKDNDVNTPAQQGRVVRIAVGSSGNRNRSSAGSSAISSLKTDSASHASHRSHSSQPENENDVPEDPQTVARERSAINLGSVSRLASSRTRGAAEESNPAIHGSMRIKRVSKVPGSFLSGPARRGRRRQSEEDAENEGGEALQSSQYPDSQQQAPDLIDLEPADNIMASSYYAPDRLSSGSPVSGGSSARAAHHKRASSVAPGAAGHNRASGLGLESKQTSPDDVGELEIFIPHYRVPPPRSDMPSRQDQENEAPSTFKRTRAPLLDKEMKVPARPLSADIGGSHHRQQQRQQQQQHQQPQYPQHQQQPQQYQQYQHHQQQPSSPADRKALASINQNTPRRSAPPAPAPPPKMSILDAATATAGAASTQQARRRNYMKVNGKCYTRLDSLGRGGSGKVYRVAADNGKMFALKRVSVEGADEATVRGFKGEIDLLQKLNGVERVINLFDYEMNEEKQVLNLLMEMGEMDLNTLLRLRLSPENARFDPVFVRFYWQEMLECLAAVHAHDIVHSDLKPANFVLVQGRLKLIDFGIANAIQTDQTVNVHRETQIGTPNYMSPESLIDFNSSAPQDARDHRPHHIGHRPKLMKLGKPSDVWSLGCILYQMVYGQPPFGHIANQMARCHAIINWNYAIEFRERGVGGAPVPPSLLRTMRRCLARDQHLRPTCAELLSTADPFLYPAEVGPDALPITEELLGRIIQSVVARCRDRMPTDAEALSVWPQAYWGSVAKAIGRDAPSASQSLPLSNTTTSTARPPSAQRDDGM
ncbi:hypothetical protein SLS62_000127 [Diatrype stigma]|uniref:Protein kinase domain-containing protein n=1 Tax=Diatrype stigma TaxID=117547 RepID=A0AAN9UY60_9PEZI